MAKHRKNVWCEFKEDGKAQWYRGKLCGRQGASDEYKIQFDDGDPCVIRRSAIHAHPPQGSPQWPSKAKKTSYFGLIKAAITSRQDRGGSPRQAARERFHSPCSTQWERGGEAAAV